MGVCSPEKIICRKVWLGSRDEEKLTAPTYHVPADLWRHLEKFAGVLVEFKRVTRTGVTTEKLVYRTRVICKCSWLGHANFLVTS